ncbi:ATP-binding cassette domain-containing protein [Ruminiclostridium herbifermentans]|uniref:ATP-binding cassette domain-containing protein n=1 Tax=Ruminiclostridium herbifermentans TaxID=2488810 RepID=A0A4U7JIY7_9FIRM|nr:ATP-binding cassette domain-containing protein [Ruminiclostridium herbifermentans]QNU68593.1 ATP-binding cassette domain-containing protein [Ruminiclostridium herbifermentans]
MILRAVNIRKTFDRADNNTCGIIDVSITIRPAEYHCIFGTSGSGKSTILNILAGMLAPSSGSVYLDNMDIYSNKKFMRTSMRINSIGYIMQSASLLSNISVYDNIIFPLEIAKKQVNYRQVEDIINKLELSHLVDAYPKELSGGEYKRVTIARTIVSNPQIILADEPTSNLDEKNANIIRNIFEDLYLEGKGIVVATHDMKFIESHHIIHNIRNGKLYYAQKVCYG